MKRTSAKVGVSSRERLFRIILDCLKEGESIEFQWLGTVYAEAGGAVGFRAERAPRVFIAYAVEDCTAAERLWSDLKRAGVEPWMDRRNLLPGQNWPRAIERAIHASDFFIPCFSTAALARPAYFHAELRYALECAARVPLDDVYLIPARLDDCAVPEPVAARTQYVDLFGDWEGGVDRILSTIAEHHRSREPLFSSGLRAEHRNARHRKPTRRGR